MAKAKVTFHRCIQDSQEYGSDDEHMVSRLFFTLEVEGKAPIDLEADIKQTVGSSYQTGPLEVASPRGYKGPFNYEGFRECAERYFRGLLGSQGSGIQMGPGTSNIRMQNNTFVREMQSNFEIDPNAPAW